MRRDDSVDKLAPLSRWSLPATGRHGSSSKISTKTNAVTGIVAGRPLRLFAANNSTKGPPERMIDAATMKPPTFDVILVHSFSRFFRDQFQLEFYVRRLAKAGVRLVSITQELGDDPMSNMIRQIMALFDEYQSKENAKHTLRAMKENARQGFWNGASPPIGYRIVEASEQRGHRTKKTLEIDPVQAETVRLIFRLAR
jgi:site-specific DNA recombinase